MSRSPIARPRVNLLVIAARVAAERSAGKELDFVFDEGYREKAVEALDDLESALTSWIAGHYGHPLTEAVEAMAPFSVERAVQSALQASAGRRMEVATPESGTEYIMHEAEHVLIDETFDLAKGSGDKGPADLWLDEVAISRLSTSGYSSGSDRLGDALFSVPVFDAVPLGSDCSVLFDALESSPPASPERAKAWKAALRRARAGFSGNSGSASRRFHQEILDALPLARDPMAREVGERMRTFYARATAAARKSLREARTLMAELDSDPERAAGKAAGRDAELRRLMDSGDYTEAEARDALGYT